MLHGGTACRQPFIAIKVGGVSDGVDLPHENCLLSMYASSSKLRCLGAADEGLCLHESGAAQSSQAPFCKQNLDWRACQGGCAVS
jgi:hypothetical protein